MNYYMELVEASSNLANTSLGMEQENSRFGILVSNILQDVLDNQQTVQTAVLNGTWSDYDKTTGKMVQHQYEGMADPGSNGNNPSSSDLQRTNTADQTLETEFSTAGSNLQSLLQGLTTANTNLSTNQQSDVNFGSTEAGYNAYVANLLA